MPKAICLQKHFSSIFPECRVEAKVRLYDESSEEEILSGKPDFVLDCIDNIDTKVSICSKLFNIFLCFRYIFYFPSTLKFSAFFFPLCYSRLYSEMLVIVLHIMKINFLSRTAYVFIPMNVYVLLLAQLL
ncbi:hypothetical protein MA16_Dca020841 [Dendrobium catenatum]|uniref:THIF-type NAD/FAD binding fold domain-containing protein n=1 Tax=Dendrobium catenatum TaxID=906689 RepID=A0A2I0VAB8_9ASPA|nr:hypothetical protein MA16_Dca028556 [Dendrobium catenatum]PKU68573.1 hypothetical protein MA16_Dca020841 [Dendrobium catenatum]